MISDYMDMINASFELLGAFILTMNISQLYKHKIVKGVHYAPTAFFTLWGCWNLLYYPHLGQWLSFGAGILLVSVNFVWLCMVFYYYNKRKV